MLGVSIDPVGSEEDLQIAEQMSDDEEDQNDASDGDNHLFANGRAVETRSGVHDLVPLENAALQIMSQG